MAVCGQNDRCLIKMLLKLSKELHEGLSVSLSLPLFTSTQAFNSLNDVLYIIKHLIPARSSNFKSEEGKNGLSGRLRRELCIKTTILLSNL
ncbi:hypothetical protein GLOIN_2v1684213 [Rhizophagus clarus]|uniref:Uncharacterized protein n=1 Tax=Rhizophagus clarus TaxID=94130 RepID=A0A8H3LNM1_9GLOM|nr:hypothetical protein GLOIN_2v1684213 [Rhizophagus clarus]